MISSSASLTIASNNNYNYCEPDIFKELMPMNYKLEILPQDKHISEQALKRMSFEAGNGTYGKERRSMNKFMTEIVIGGLKDRKKEITCEVTLKKINEACAKFVVACLKDTIPTLKKREKYADGYLIKYLDKTEEEQLNEAEVAYDILTFYWTDLEDK